ncbi:hypothetical protein AGABI1DRAFT_115410 [Agaricus bisporus var. burnettii JB137-S8]|uniref:Transmembrane protein 19 n=1 Tax=Agaricus bisporus var. burnettii (strain JB137-S8 / ATCC MYA-4627 / FGSC 10392) TaxID=597362 RepID=K5XQZ6_AGABU|nr:uncharacterized protein AGABI1DRAFT_115410 [Agaricus bisporus var. burnettii JB137-S8]EKM77260.1 hypothetical protein AGABI1DRAFT_115410 [Agaricus bisporus var. burnettii JB137-S8]
MQVVPLVLALLLSLHGLRKKSLSPSGALTAFCVGYGTLSGGLWVFGITLIGFYLIGSRATKYGKQRKAKLEEGYQEAGYRSGWQVLCNSVCGVAAAVMWNAMFGVEYDSSKWCPLDREVGNGWSRMLLFVALGHFACCLGDTLASELGILSAGKPRLVTTFERVPPGTNGGMSVGGTLASLLGGAAVGVLMASTLVVENVRCREAWSSVTLSLIVGGALAGFLGSLIDSLIGATLQQTRYSQGRVSTEGEVISGLNVLTNNQVNLVSSVITSVVSGVVSRSR